MLAAVDFDNQPRRKTDEIEHVTLQGRLPSEIGAELTPAYAAPEAAFGVRHVVTEHAGGSSQGVGHGCR